jgi:hypothetical protein
MGLGLASTNDARLVQMPRHLDIALGACPHISHCAVLLLSGVRRGGITISHLNSS